jgi:signal transduction histidine kinase/ligand-binding sensor domain-containing protein
MFSNISNTQGLSNNRVQAILKDSRGFMWFGTVYGLNRFDGYNFKIYLHNPADSNSLSDNPVNFLFEDNEGKIWVQSAFNTDAAGLTLNIFDPVTEIFHHDHKLFHKGVPQKLNIKIIKDKNKNIWFANSSSGLYKYDVQHDSVFHLSHNKDDIGTINSNKITDLIEDNEGYLWVIDTFGVFQKIDPVTLKVMLLRNDIVKPNAIYHMFIDSDNDIWIYATSNGGGTILYKQKSGSYLKFLKGTPGFSLNNENVICIIEDDNKLLWFGTDHGGVNIYNKSTGTFEYVYSNPIDDKSLCQNSIRSLYKEDNGTIWIGTFKKGISYYNRDLFKFGLYKNNPEDETSLSYNDILKFVEDQYGNIWIGTDGGGLIYFDRFKNSFTTYKNNSHDANSISADIVIGMCIDYKNRLWVGTYFGGLNYFDGKKFHHFRHDPSNPETICDDRIWEIHEDKDHLLWIGSLMGGMDIFDPEKGKVIKHFNGGQNIHSVGANSVLTIIEDNNKDIWTATSWGIDRYDRKSGFFTHYINNPDDPGSISSNLIFDILQDSRGIIWAASGNGLNMFDQKTEKFRVFKTEDGLPSNYIVTLVEDNSGNLWMGTSSGLSNLRIKENPENKNFEFEFVNYNNGDGLQGPEFNENAVLKTRKGELLFGGGYGFNLFNPTDLKKSNLVTPIVITDFQIFNKSLKLNEKFDDRFILKNSITYTSDINLKHKENLFSIEFSSLNYFHPEIRKYKYMMEGFNKEWLITDAAHRKVTFTNLDPGKYIFRVVSTNNDGTWSNIEAILKIRILPPYWKTWWFRIIILLIIIVSVVLFFLFRVDQLKKQKIHLEKMVAVRTKEVEDKNRELTEQTNLLNESNSILTERQQQIEEQSEELLTQKEKLESINTHLQELNTTKDKFFSIIAHDLRNPFQSILGFAELLENRYDTLTELSKKKYINAIYTSANSLYKLLENLLYWARSQTNQLNVVKTDFSIQELIKENLIILAENSSIKNLKIHVHLNESMWVYADYHMTSTVIRNIISNAIKFTPFSGEIKISTFLKDNFVQVEIEDNGIGISEEQKTKLFKVEAYYSNKGTEGETGSGIGLILCKEFVERNGGKIWFESTLGLGSKFSFTLPLSGKLQKNSYTFNS